MAGAGVVLRDPWGKLSGAGVLGVVSYVTASDEVGCVCRLIHAVGDTSTSADRQHVT